MFHTNNEILDDYKILFSLQRTSLLKLKFDEIKRSTAKRPAKSVAADKIPDKAYDIEAIMLEKGASHARKDLPTLCQPNRWAALRCVS